MAKTKTNGWKKRYNKPEPGNVRGLCVACKKYPQKKMSRPNMNGEATYYPLCNSCDKKRYNTSKYIAAKYIKYRYGVTPKAHNKMLKQQKHRCAICRKHKKNLDVALAVDHCHTSKKVRGLLCRSCNVGLGYFQDDIALLKKAIKYLKDSA